MHASTDIQEWVGLAGLFPEPLLLHWGTARSASGEDPCSPCSRRSRVHMDKQVWFSQDDTRGGISSHPCSISFSFLRKALDGLVLWGDIKRSWLTDHMILLWYGNGIPAEQFQKRLPDDDFPRNINAAEVGSMVTFTVAVSKKSSWFVSFWKTPRKYPRKNFGFGFYFFWFWVLGFGYRNQIISCTEKELNRIL